MSGQVRAINQSSALSVGESMRSRPADVFTSTGPPEDIAELGVPTAVGGQDVYRA